MDDRPEWFSAKRYGYGTALPISWQGWLVMAIYFFIAIGSAFLFAKRPLILLSIIFPATVIFLVVAAKTTKGGMRWRWGGEE